MSIKHSTMAWKRRGHPHAQLHFPPLTAHEALLLCNLLDRAISALWRAHGDAMADLLANLDPDSAVSDQPPDVFPPDLTTVSEDIF